MYALISLGPVVKDVWNMKKDNKDMLRRIKQEREKKVFVPAKVLLSSSVVSLTAGFSNSIEQKKFCSLKNIRSFEVRDFLYGKFQTNILFSNNASAFGGLSLHRVEVTQTRTNRGLTFLAKINS